ncbi:MAG TPA: HemK/PrmC family methyltransferase [Gordonia sp. (in: high G+C Gram-positive bacteria)]|uniref:N5-glutamine methyltransferase family protein n=1 Tax=unclassified Gordonia (in: high G+C Gram-positive bacteria) TaxID=2657482 RepID=UPI000FBCF0DA|nr:MULTISPECIES: HemK/PrmC family methyltransferase [unclassified Gordonia (in: high G+C Gram-positive bacteria)]RUP39214.1 MAG: peptide chain release factor N(5)-glutamine methyltransferase [Gordonia sp. (in: high G+C Gram-positive bacteria)]HNP57458.1 HemK/PrmC family methyltransferase [Gordonia sp. (in: high G+C Gram-positive bacteria)]HRC51219.1 HemK/PrmC family methyltransferase [Gordonia sp. (in: high G+C Gram-positive bacteria)]
MRTARVLADAVEALTAAGVDSPQPDARWLLAHALRVDVGRLILVDEVDETALRRFRDDVARRAAREPLQHILGRVGFGADTAAIDLRVGPGVFVPRPETELLLQWAVATAPRGALVADLCSGSGALALGLATARPDVRVLAVELFDDARTWLRRNAAAQPVPVATRVAVVAADVTDPGGLAAAIAAQAGPTGWPVDAALDLVVANPPYVPELTDGTPTPISPEVAADPHRAVFAGADGMAVITPMLQSVRALGRPGTALGVEHDDATGPAVAAAMDAAGFAAIEPHDDLAGAQRFTTAVQG